MTRRLLITVVVTVTLLLAAIVLYRFSYERLRTYDNAVEHTREVIYNFSELNSLLKSVKIYSRNYNYSNAHDLLDRYIGVKSNAKKHLTFLKESIADNPDQSKRIDSLANAVDRFLAVTDEQIGATGPAQIDSLNRLAINLLLGGPEPMVHRGIAVEEKLLKQRQAAMDEWGDWLNIWVAVFIGAAMLLLILSIASNYNQFRRRQSAEDFLQSILNTTQNGVMAYSVVRSGDDVVDFKVTFANRGIHKQWRREPEEVIGKRYFELWPDAPKTGAFERFVNVYRSGIPEEFETKSIEPGSDEWFHVSVARMQDGVTVTFNNITAIKRFEAQLQQKIQELVRTNGELEQFAYVSSHDLQEPLRKIEMFSTLAEQRYGDAIPEEANAYLNKIMQSSQRMRSLINDLLNYSRVSRRHEPFVPTDLNDVLGNVAADFELLIGEKKATLNIGRLPVIEAVPLQMNQLFQNLMSNSLKFTAPNRAPRIEVSAVTTDAADLRFGTERDDASGFCEITWCDNGIGIEPRFADKIFTIFQRLHTRDEYEGTGIGLALCKKIAVNHGGNIVAEPSENGGALFRILLPVKQPKPVDVERVS